MTNKIRWITRTALCIALLVVMQLTTAPLGNTLITGSLVNMMLVISVIIMGLWSGIAVSFLSPIFASFLGIAPPFPIIIPFIGLGNAALVVVWHLLAHKVIWKQNASYALALVLGAFAKFIVLYIGVAVILVPMVLQLPEPQASVISGIFSIPQLVTALAGGVIALCVLPVLKKAVFAKV